MDGPNQPHLTFNPSRPGKQYLAFDLETVKPFPQGTDWREHRPLGIGCAALHSSGQTAPATWCSRNPDGSIAERMTRKNLQALVRHLTDWIQAPGEPRSIVTWNGLGFDFDVLAEESEMPAECRELALAHVDMMFHVFCELGYPIGLAAAARGMGTAGKTSGMDGSIALQVWQDGDRQQVLDYCAQDVRSTLELAEACHQQRKLQWTSKAGIPHTLWLPNGWLPVSQALEIPEPDTSWMTNLIPRTRFTGWLSTSPGRKPGRETNDQDNE